MRLNFTIGNDRNEGNKFREYIYDTDITEFRADKTREGEDVYDLPEYGCRLAVFHPVDFEMNGMTLKGRLSGSKGGIFKKGVRKALARLEKDSGIKLRTYEDGR